MPGAFQGLFVGSIMGNDDKLPSGILSRGEERGRALKVERIAALADADNGDAMDFKLAIGVTQMFGHMDTCGETRTELEVRETDVDVGRFQRCLLALPQCELLQPLHMAQQAHTKRIFSG